MITSSTSLYRFQELSHFGSYTHLWDIAMHLYSIHLRYLAMLGMLPITVLT